MLSTICCCLGLGSRGNKVGGLDRNIYFLMLGLDNAGKTCTAKSLVGDKSDKSAVAPTLGFSKVETKYKGFHVTIYDLGGSKGFRSIWPKYYHEVHGFIFVVDSTDPNRLTECRETFREMLKHDKVRGKPVLLLCNKNDVDDAQDRDVIVDSLNVERSVNEARCPTRVDTVAAISGQGLKDGFKWLSKSVIANLADLGPRVQADIEFEKRLENKRKEELRKRIEARKKLEGGGSSEDHNKEEVETANRGFVPMSEIRSKLASPKKKPPVIVDVSELEPEHTPVESLPNIPEEKHQRGTVEEMMSRSTNTSSNGDLFVVHTEQPGSSEDYHKHNGVYASMTSTAGLPPIISPVKKEKKKSVEELELEPISQPKKKRNFLKKLNNKTAPSVTRRYSVDSYGKSNSSKASVLSSAESLRDVLVIKAYS